LAGGEKFDVWHRLTWFGTLVRPKDSDLTHQEWTGPRCTHIKGFDLKDVKAAETDDGEDAYAETCKKKCLDNAECGGVTWNTDTKMCYLVDWLCTSDPNRKGVTKAAGDNVDSFYIARNVWKANVKGKGGCFLSASPWQSGGVAASPVCSIAAAPLQRSGDQAREAKMPT